MTPMERFDRAASGFGARVDGVTGEGWDRPSPCEGWAARDVVGHLVEWVPPFLASGAGIDIEPGPSPEEDPVGAWWALEAALRGLLAGCGPDDRFSNPRVGDHALDDAIDRFITGDILIHTWDLARATGQDDRLDPELAVEQLAGMEPMAEMLAASGHYAPAVPVPADADVQTRLLAVSGRVP